MRSKLVGLALVAVTLAACSGVQSGIPETTTAAEVAGGPTAAPVATVGAGEEAPDEGHPRDAIPLPDGQKTIVTGEMHIEAADTRAAMDRVSRIVSEAGGFVAAADVRPTEAPEDQPVISLTLRIPAGELGGALEAIRQVADEVKTESLTTQDVTEEYVDVEARLRNLQALEEELRALLAEVRQQPDADPDELLRVFDEISNVRGQIEQLEGRRRVLDDRVDLSTLRLTISPLPITTPIVDEGWRPGVTARDSLRALVETLQGLADGAIRFGLFVLPVLVLLAAPASALWWVWRRFSRPSSPPPPTEEREPVGAGKE